MAVSAALDVARRLDQGRAWSRNARVGGLRRFFTGEELIHMLERRHGYVPRRFVWRGCRYDVTAVERCWTISRPGLGGRVRRLAFRVRFRSRSDNPGVERMATIYRDLKHNAWYARPFSR